MWVADIQRFCMHDGPGVRTTVFLKGCPLRCAWCHNPETQRPRPELLVYPEKCLGCGACGVCPVGAQQVRPERRFDREACIGCGVCAGECPTGALELCGGEYTPEALLEVVRRDEAFYGDTGGVTLSGGEPLAQGAEAVEFLRLCKAAGLSTAVETCGQVAPEVVAAAVPVTDLFLWDVKDTDSRRHLQYTGVSGERIRENLRLADSLGGKTCLRCILVNGVNTDQAHYGAVAALYHSLRYCEGVELLPYHVYGGSKAAALGRPDSGRRDWIPSAAVVAEAKQALREQGTPVWG